MQKCIVLYNLEELYTEFKRFKWSRWRLPPNICHKQQVTLENSSLIRKSEFRWFHTINKFIISLLSRHYYTSKYQAKHFINLQESLTRWKALNKFYRKLIFHTSGDSPTFSLAEILNALYTHWLFFFTGNNSIPWIRVIASFQIHWNII